MRKFIPIIAFALLSIPSVSQAAAASGYVTNIVTVYEDHAVIFDQSGTRTNNPTCAQNTPQRWAFDTSTPLGQSELAVLLSAYALHKPIAIEGLGTCDAHFDTETVKYINILD